MERDAKRVEWRARLEAYAASGLTQREWCAREGVSLHQLGYWRGQLREQSKPIAATPGWCALDVVAEHNSGGNGLTVRVGSAGIEVRPGFDAALLRDIVRALEVAPC